MSETDRDSAVVADGGGGVRNSRVTWEGCSVLLDINDGDRMLFSRLSPAATVKIGNKNYSLKPLIGCPFGSLFQVDVGADGPCLTRVDPLLQVCASDLCLILSFQTHNLTPSTRRYLPSNPPQILSNTHPPRGISIHRSVHLLRIFSSLPSQFINQPFSIFRFCFDFRLFQQMMQRLVDNVLAVAKESVKTFTYESLNNIARLINGISALLLTLLPGKTSILEGIHGWELKPSFRGPRLPRWMENGVSSFNQFIHDLSVDSDDSSNVDYSSDGDYSDEDIYPASPSSHSSKVSRSSSFSRHDRRATNWIKFIFMWILLPAKIFISIPLYFFRILIRRGSRQPFTAESQCQPHVHSIKKAHGLKDHIIQRTTDKRRGIIEDLHVATEIIIEAVFDFFHKAAHVVLSPSEAFGILFRSQSFERPTYNECSNGESVDSVLTATLGSNDSSPTERRTNFQSMNTDARTCEDVITELGYPYEAIRVVTSDGYVLLLERIPRI